MRVSDLKWRSVCGRTSVGAWSSRGCLTRRTHGIRAASHRTRRGRLESIDPCCSRELPNLKRLIDAGVRGSLRFLNPMISPLLWTTVATGKGRTSTGVADFSVVEAKTGRKPSVPGTGRCAVWNISLRVGRSSAVVGWWASFPPTGWKGSWFWTVSAR